MAGMLSFLDMKTNDSGIINFVQHAQEVLTVHCVKDHGTKSENANAGTEEIINVSLNCDSLLYSQVSWQFLCCSKCIRRFDLRF